eukprot:Opistho-2@3038
MASEEQLRGLESLLGQLGTGQLEPSLKAQYERALMEFRAQPDAWRQCTYFLNNTDNPLVLFYSVSVFEALVYARWPQLPRSERNEIKTFLYNYYVGKFGAIPNFVSNKLAKVVVDISKWEWPQEAPEFFPSIFNMVDSGNTLAASAGVRLLLTVSEEYTSTRDDHNAARKQQLRALLEEQVPSIFDGLCRILEGLHTRCVVFGSPRPSP